MWSDKRTNLTKRLIGMRRSAKQSAMIVADACLLAFSVWAAYSLRLGEFFVPSLAQWGLVLSAPLLAVPVFIRFGLYRSVIRYVGEQAIWSVIKGVSLAALLWAGLAFMTAMTGVEGAPRSVLVIYWLLGVLLVGGVRFAARWILWAPARERFQGRQVLIYGAGGAGRQVARSLRMGRELFPAGFIDDDTGLCGKDVDGLRVYSPRQLATLIERFGIRDVIVTIPSVSNARRREIVLFLESFPVKVRILPALTDIASGKHLVNLVREVDIGDLLGRESVPAASVLLAKCIADKSVLVTGAGGSIGAELCRQVTALHPSRLVMLESNEHALYQIERELARTAKFELIACLGSVRDEPLVRNLLKEHSVGTVYHAAAHKHVPMVEANPMEGTASNVFGTEIMARVSHDCGVETFVLISTDKAVRPTNIMGATKRWAERVIQHCSDKVGTTERVATVFCAVRFGNVLGSSGSVVPLFREQIANGGPVTVTHHQVTRFFMSIHEAVALVIQAGSMAKGGEIFLLDMGEPVKIMDLARNMIQLAGFTVKDDTHPDGDIEIEVTGLRPGEKLYEELLIDGANARGTNHPQIMKAIERVDSGSEFPLLIKRLGKRLAEGDEKGLRELLMKEAGASTNTSAGKSG